MTNEVRTTRFSEAIRVLSDPKEPITDRVVQNFSDLGDADRQLLMAEWALIPLDRRRMLLRRIAEMSENDFHMEFSGVIRIALTDLDAEMRQIAVEASWTDESPDMMNRLMPLASIDPSEGVRAAAVSALGRFILQGELGKFSASLARQAQNVAIKLYNNANESIEVRRRALEAVSNSSRAEVTGMVTEAYDSKHPRMRASAVFAMGRTCDARWSSAVLEELTSEDAEMRFEATRAAGELELEDSVPLLARLLEDESRQIVEMAVWSLGEIGTEEAQSLLERFAERAERRGDDALLDMIEDALANASLAGADLGDE
jgi:hypothetical protein